MSEEPRSTETSTEMPPQSCPCDRRTFLRMAGWGGLLAAFGGSCLAAVRFFFPRVLFEPSPVFKAGLASELPLGSVTTKYKDKYGVWIVRDTSGIYALLAKCTHLGCTPLWLAAENRFKCPCHGSAFTKEGINYEGPAPRPLERVRISLAEDGQILIDKSKKFRQERGEWGKPGSILKV